jgi:hypothetical protein
MLIPIGEVIVEFDDLGIKDEIKHRFQYLLISQEQYLRYLLIKTNVFNES